jgi:biotin-(acetyl-CoA carboxylase) ligase
VIAGIASDIDIRGALVLTTDSGTRTITAGEVTVVKK